MTSLIKLAEVSVGGTVSVTWLKPRIYAYPSFSELLSLKVSNVTVCQSLGTLKHATLTNTTIIYWLDDVKHPTQEFRMWMSTTWSYPPGSKIIVRMEVVVEFYEEIILRLFHSAREIINDIFSDYRANNCLRFIGLITSSPPLRKRSMQMVFAFSVGWKASQNTDFDRSAQRLLIVRHEPSSPL